MLAGPVWPAGSRCFPPIALWRALGSWWDNRGWAAVAVAVLWAVIGIRGPPAATSLKHVKGMPRTVETAERSPDARENEDQS